MFNSVTSMSVVTATAVVPSSVAQLTGLAELPLLEITLIQAVQQFLGKELGWLTWLVVNKSYGVSCLEQCH